jgi:hypothetical protein
MKDKFLKIAGVETVSSLAGFSVLSDGIGASFGMNLIGLKKWDERVYSDKEIIQELNQKTSSHSLNSALAISSRLFHPAMKPSINAR